MIDASLSAGVDVGSTWLDLGFHPFAKPIRARNSEAGIETIIAALRERGVAKVALEAIGGYGRKLVAALIEADLNVFVVNPRRIKAFRDLIAKTDRLDAALIARFAHAMAHELRPLPDAEQAVLKALSTRRRQLTESIAIEKTRLKQAFDPLIVESCREMIALLEDKRRAIEADLDRRIDAEDRMARRRAILSSIPGVGARISALVIVEMPELGAIGLIGFWRNCQESCVRGHSDADGGRIWQSRRTPWTVCWRGVTRRLFSPRTGYSTS